MSTATDVAEAFKHDIAEHAMTVLHEDGLYRHLRFRRPDRSTAWFDLITWPGNLAIKGDMGAYLFARETDMFVFFRSSGNRINPGYWAEKLPDCGKSVQEYSEDVLRANLDDRMTEYEEEYPDLRADYLKAKAAFELLSPDERRQLSLRGKEPRVPKSPAQVRVLIEQYDQDGELGYEDGARRLLRELEAADVVSDTWEWSLKEYSYHYLWCCHAIVWGIRQYDAVSALVPADRLLQLEESLRDGERP